MKFLAILCLIGVAIAHPHGINENRLGNPDEWGSYFESDIRLPLPPRGKNGLIDTSYRWPNGQVPYEFAPTFQASKIPTVESAMQLYSDNTGGCITFVPRTTETDYVEFLGDDLDGCWSYVGKVGGKQNINYPQWCIDQFGSVQHEMLHALGFYHQQSTYNRDDFVTIMWANIQIGMEGNFLKYSDTVVTDFGTAYDYLSVMHYSQYGFSRNGEPTIVTTDPAYQTQIGQRAGLSATDLEKLLSMYNCPAVPKN